MPKGNDLLRLRHIYNNRWFTNVLHLFIGLLVGFWIGSSSKNDVNVAKASSDIASSWGLSGGTTLKKSNDHLKRCDISTNLHHLQNNTKFGGYPEQYKSGPMQADEMLLLFSLVRTSFVSRVLEIGGLRGDSAWNFLEGLRCKDNAMVYTVDIEPGVPQHDHPTVTHKTIIKDGADLVIGDIDSQPIDLLLLDCHNYNASQHILNAVLKQNLLSPQGYIVLHDTGFHRLDLPFPHGLLLIRTKEGFVQQPVERLLADWIPLQDCSFQRISFHDDHREYPRHGITILQRRVPLYFEECLSAAIDGKTPVEQLFNFKQKDCDEVKAYTAKVRKECPDPGMK